MPIQLDKILADIAEEKPLHPQSDAAKSKKDQDEAWIKVGKKNKLSGGTAGEMLKKINNLLYAIAAHEAKSIFKVLQKKYEQEKLKPSSTWKLFQQMEDICKKHEEFKPKLEEEATEQEEESMVEFLEVREEDDDYEGDSDNQDKSMRSISPTGSSPEKETPSNVEIKPELKVLNSNIMVSQATSAVKPEFGQIQQQQEKQTAFSKALQNKNISLRKTNSGALPMKQTTLTKIAPKPGNEKTRSMLLPESIKRKLLSVEIMQQDEAISSKRMKNITRKETSTTALNVQIPEIEIKKEAIEEMDSIMPTTSMTPTAGINVITIPSNNQTMAGELSNGMTTIKSNGYNTQLEELDFQKDIIFENNPSSSSKTLNHTAAPGEIINIGNFDNQLPPTFFKNLCNSNRHEALGLYVANVMNRVSGRTAAKLEINILKAIIEAQSDEFARL